MILQAKMQDFWWSQVVTSQYPARIVSTSTSQHHYTTPEKLTELEAPPPKMKVWLPIYISSLKGVIFTGIMKKMPAILWRIKHHAMMHGQNLKELSPGACQNPGSLCVNNPFIFIKGTQPMNFHDFHWVFQCLNRQGRKKHEKIHF